MTELARIPIIPLGRNLIVSIQGSLTDSQVGHLKDDITAAIEDKSPQGLVVDLSGVDLLDSYISRAIRDIGLIARHMVANTVIAGMDPMIAMTLVEMDLDFKNVRTALNLDTVIAHLNQTAYDDEVLMATMAGDIDL